MGCVHPRTSWTFAALVAWTGFVWIGRIRNALTDPALEGWELASPLLLSLSFVLPAVVLGASWLVGTRRGSGPSRPLLVAVVAFCCWTIGVWVLRGADIAFAGDHEAAFVAVHTVLALVSIALASIVLARTVTAAVGQVSHTRSGTSATS